MHSCRRYFRTNAVRGMGLDLVEMMMGHEGYLTKSYRRIPQDEARKQFHEGELVLFITVASKRTEERIVEGVKQEMTGKLSELERRNAELTARLSQVEQVQQEKSAIRAAGAELSPTQMQELAEKVASTMTKGKI